MELTLGKKIPREGGSIQGVNNVKETYNVGRLFLTGPTKGFRRLNKS